MAAAGVGGGVGDAAEGAGAEAGAVEGYGGGGAGVVEVFGLVYVGEDGSFYNDSVLQTLAEEPGEVDGGVHADGGEGGAGVAVCWQLGFGKNLKLCEVLDLAICWRFG